MVPDGQSARDDLTAPTPPRILDDDRLLPLYVAGRHRAHHRVARCELGHGLLGLRIKRPGRIDVHSDIRSSIIKLRNWIPSVFYCEIIVALSDGYPGSRPAFRSGELAYPLPCAVVGESPNYHRREPRDHLHPVESLKVPETFCPAKSTTSRCSCSVGRWRGWSECDR